MFLIYWRALPGLFHLFFGFSLLPCAHFKRYIFHQVTKVCQWEQPYKKLLLTSHTMDLSMAVLQKARRKNTGVSKLTFVPCSILAAFLECVSHCSSETSWFVLGTEMLRTVGASPLFAAESGFGFRFCLCPLPSFRWLFPSSGLFGKKSQLYWSS